MGTRSSNGVVLKPREGFPAVGPARGPPGAPSRDPSLEKPSCPPGACRLYNSAAVRDGWRRVVRGQAFRPRSEGRRIFMTTVVERREMIARLRELPARLEAYLPGFLDGFHWPVEPQEANR